MGFWNYGGGSSFLGGIRNAWSRRFFGVRIDSRVGSLKKTDVTRRREEYFCNVIPRHYLFYDFINIGIQPSIIDISNECNFSSREQYKSEYL